MESLLLAYTKARPSIDELLIRTVEGICEELKVDTSKISQDDVESMIDDTRNLLDSAADGDKDIYCDASSKTTHDRVVSSFLRVFSTKTRRIFDSKNQNVFHSRIHSVLWPISSDDGQEFHGLAIIGGHYCDKNPAKKGRLCEEILFLPSKRFNAAHSLQSTSSDYKMTSMDCLLGPDADSSVDSHSKNICFRSFNHPELKGIAQSITYRQNEAYLMLTNLTNGPSLMNCLVKITFDPTVRDNMDPFRCFILNSSGLPSTTGLLSILKNPHEEEEEIKKQREEFIHTTVKTPWKEFGLLMQQSTTYIDTGGSKPTDRGFFHKSTINLPTSEDEHMLSSFSKAWDPEHQDNKSEFSLNPMLSRKSRFDSKFLTMYASDSENDQETLQHNQTLDQVKSKLEPFGKKLIYWCREHVNDFGNQYPIEIRHDARFQRIKSTSSKVEEKKQHSRDHHRPGAMYELLYLGNDKNKIKMDARLENIDLTDKELEEIQTWHRINAEEASLPTEVTEWYGELVKNPSLEPIVVAGNMLVPDTIGREIGCCGENIYIYGAYPPQWVSPCTVWLSKFSKVNKSWSYRALPFAPIANFTLHQISSTVYSPLDIIFLLTSNTVGIFCMENERWYSSRIIRVDKKKKEQTKKKMSWYRRKRSELASLLFKGTSSDNNELHKQSTIPESGFLNTTHDTIGTTNDSIRTTTITEQSHGNQNNFETNIRQRASVYEEDYSTLTLTGNNFDFDNDLREDWSWMKIAITGHDVLNRKLFVSLVDLSGQIKEVEIHIGPDVVIHPVKFPNETMMIEQTRNSNNIYKEKQDEQYENKNSTKEKKHINEDLIYSWPFA